MFRNEVLHKACVLCGGMTGDERPTFAADEDSDIHSNTAVLRSVSADSALNRQPAEVMETRNRYSFLIHLSIRM